MLREIVKIDEELCNGCGDCVPNCHEGALQIIDNKARLISDLMCDGLGACLGHCPEGAITIEKREAEPYDEVKVMQEMVHKGKNTVIAHMRHLKDHNEHDFLKQALHYLLDHANELSFDPEEVRQAVHQEEPESMACGCPGSLSKSFGAQNDHAGSSPQTGSLESALTHWPVQLHLISPRAAHFRKSDLLLAADCTAFALGGFHSEYLKGKTLAIACPKLDHDMEIYVEKIRQLIDEAEINTLTVMIMEVPCCGGLLQLVQAALQGATKHIPVKKVVVSAQGQILQEVWN